MKVLKLGSFDDLDDPICTEALIASQLESLGDSVLPEWTYVRLPLAWLMNKRGKEVTQAILNQIFDLVDSSRLLFVCQHIHYKTLDFRRATIFTPHAESGDGSFSIPHHAVNAPREIGTLRPMESRKYLASFRGAYWTHPCRQQLGNILAGREFFLEDTGRWHFEKDEVAQEESRERYQQLLLDSKFTLCPRGTGATSVRLWEALACGSIPVIISDMTVLPLANKIPWKKFSLRVSEAGIKTLPMLLNLYANEDLKAMAELGSQYYRTWFSNEKLFSTIVATLTEITSVREIKSA